MRFLQRETFYTFRITVVKLTMCHSYATDTVGVIMHQLHHIQNIPLIGLCAMEFRLLKQKLLFYIELIQKLREIFWCMHKLLCVQLSTYNYVL